MSRQHNPELVVTCPTCETREEPTQPNDAIEMYRRHRSVTGHQIEWERADLDVEVPSGDVKTVLDELGEHFEDGVPIGLLTAAMSEQEISIGETLDEIYDLRMTGHVHEPRDDHLTAI